MYEIYVAVKLSALQFGQALLDYHASAKDCPLYESLASEDCFHCTWFCSDVILAFDQMFGQELRLEQCKKNRHSEDSLFWDVPFGIRRAKGASRRLVRRSHADILCRLARGGAHHSLHGYSCRRRRI